LRKHRLDETDPLRFLKNFEIRTQPKVAPVLPKNVCSEGVKRCQQHPLFRAWHQLQQPLAHFSCSLSSEGQAQNPECFIATLLNEPPDTGSQGRSLTGPWP